MGCALRLVDFPCFTYPPAYDLSPCHIAPPKQKHPFAAHWGPREFQLKIYHSFTFDVLTGTAVGPQVGPRETVQGMGGGYRQAVHSRGRAHGRKRAKSCSHFTKEREAK